MMPPLATGSAAPRRQFRAAKTRQPPEEARRQAAVAARAWQSLGDRDLVMAFLNEPHALLGARPLDVAIGSDAGLADVLALLAPPTKEIA